MRPFDASPAVRTGRRLQWLIVACPDELQRFHCGAGLPGGEKEAKKVVGERASVASGSSGSTKWLASQTRFRTKERSPLPPGTQSGHGFENLNFVDF